MKETVVTNWVFNNHNNIFKVPLRQGPCAWQKYCPNLKWVKVKQEDEDSSDLNQEYHVYAGYQTVLRKEKTKWNERRWKRSTQRGDREGVGSVCCLYHYLATVVSSLKSLHFLVRQNFADSTVIIIAPFPSTSQVLYNISEGTRVHTFSG